MTRAAIYARISKDTEDTRLGVERQEEDCRKICADRGWEVAGVYIDNDISAADPKKRRPEYERLLKDIASGQVDAIVVWAEDRLHRRPVELESFMATCDAAGLTKLASYGGDIDLSDPDALFMLRLKGNMAAREVAVTSRRGKRKMQQKAEAGEFHGGPRPFGYESDGIQINEAEAILVREAAARILEGSSLRAIAKDFNERGIRTSWDKAINETGLKKMLTSGRVAGLRLHQGDIIGKAKWGAILDEATWKQVCTILKDPARRGPRPSRSHPLRGVLKCGRCGTMLTASPRSEGRRYVCHSRHGCGKLTIKADWVEEFVFDLLLPMADSPDLRDVLRTEEEGGAAAARELLVANSQDDRKLSELDEMFTDGDIDKAHYLKASKKLRDRMAARDAQLATLRGRTAVSRLGGDVQSSWDEMSADDKRSIILSLITHIEIKPSARQGRHTFDPDRLNIVFRYEPISKMVHLYRGKNGNWRGWVTAKVSA